MCEEVHMGLMIKMCIERLMWWMGAGKIRELICGVGRDLNLRGPPAISRNQVDKKRHLFLIRQKVVMIRNMRSLFVIALCLLAFGQIHKVKAEVETSAGKLDSA